MGLLRKPILQKGLHPDLDSEIMRSIDFLIPIFALDPAIHVNRYLNLLPQHNTPLWSDASGFEKDSKNPTPGMVASYFLAPFLKTSHLIFKVTSYLEIKNLIIREGVQFINLPFSRLDLEKDELAIAYLELITCILTSSLGFSLGFVF